MFAVIVADAPGIDIQRFRPEIERAALRIAADGGARYLVGLDLLPDLVIGDLDSISADLQHSLEAQGVRFERYPAAKDETDLELALLRALELGASEIAVLAALGGRPDQHLANLLLLAHPLLRRRHVSLRDGDWAIRLVDGSIEIDGAAGDLVSLLPLGSAYGVTTEGLLYPLRNETLLLGPARGVSNALLGQRARVSVAEGLLLLFHCHGDSGVPPLS